MLYLLFSIMMSVTASVLLSLTKKYSASLAQIVFFNYIAAIILILAVFFPKRTDFVFDFDLWWIFIVLGFMLPTVFIFLGKSIQKSGIAVTDTAQRLSFVIGFVAAFVIFNEPLNFYKIIAFILSVIAVLLLISKENKQSGFSLWMLGVFLGYGSCDILFKLISVQSISYQTYLLVSFAIAAFYMLCYLLIKKEKFSLKNMELGLALGVVNFLNIVTYIQAHKLLSGKTAFVITTMNIGVIVVSILVGTLFLKETIAKRKIIGICIAILSSLLFLFSY